MSVKYDLHYVEFSIKGSDTVALTNMIGQETLGVDNTANEIMPLMSANTGFNTLKGRLYDRYQYKGIIEQPNVW